MKRLAVDVLYLLPGAVLVVIGVANLMSSYVPWIATNVGHAPIWLSAGLIVFGVLGVSPYLVVMRLRRRLRNMGRAHAQGS